MGRFATSYAAANAASKVKAAASKVLIITAERDALRRNHELLREQHELLKRGVKAERLDVRQLETELAAQQKRLDAMAAELGLPASAPAPTPRCSKSSIARLPVVDETWRLREAQTSTLRCRVRPRRTIEFQ